MIDSPRLSHPSRVFTIAEHPGAENSGADPARAGPLLYNKVQSPASAPLTIAGTRPQVEARRTKFAAEKTDASANAALCHGKALYEVHRGLAAFQQFDVVLEIGCDLLEDRWQVRHEIGKARIVARPTMVMAAMIEKVTSLIFRQ